MEGKSGKDRCKFISEYLTNFTVFNELNSDTCAFLFTYKNICDFTFLK